MDMLDLSNFPQNQTPETYGCIQNSAQGQPVSPHWLEDLSEEDQAKIELVRKGEVERALIVKGSDFWLCEYQPNGLTGPNKKQWGYTVRHYRQRRGMGWPVAGCLVFCLVLSLTFLVLSERSAYWLQTKFDETLNKFAITTNKLIETQDNLTKANDKNTKNENLLADTRRNLTQAQTDLLNSNAQIETLKANINKMNKCFSSTNSKPLEIQVYTIRKSGETINKVRERYPSLTLKSIQRDNKALQIIQSLKIKRGDVVIFEKTPGSSNSCIQEVSTVTQELKSNPVQ